MEPRSRSDSGYNVALSLVLRGQFLCQPKASDIHRTWFVSKHQQILWLRCGSSSSNRKNSFISLAQCPNSASEGEKEGAWMNGKPVPCMVQVDLCSEMMVWNFINPLHAEHNRRNVVHTFNHYIALYKRSFHFLFYSLSLFPTHDSVCLYGKRVYSIPFIVFAQSSCLKKWVECGKLNEMKRFGNSGKYAEKWVCSFWLPLPNYLCFDDIDIFCDDGHCYQHIITSDLSLHQNPNNHHWFIPNGEKHCIHMWKGE